MKKVIITGAGGFIGKSLIKKLLSKNIIVYGIDINDRPLEEFKYFENFYPIVIKNDIDLSLLDSLNNEQIDTFFHLGWGGSLLSTDLNNFTLQISNIQMSMKYLEKMDKLGIKNVIFGSSSYQYMIDNQTNLQCNYYGLSKKTVEDMFFAYCFNHQIKCNIAILTNTYGIGDYSNKAVNSLLKSMIHKEKLILVEGLYKNDWVYIDDTVNGLISVANCPKSYQRYYIGHIEISTFKDKILEMLEITKYNEHVIFGEYIESSHVDYSLLDARKILEDTGFKCSCPFHKGIELTVSWLKERGI